MKRGSAVDSTNMRMVRMLENPMSQVAQFFSWKPLIEAAIRRSRYASWMKSIDPFQKHVGMIQFFSSLLAHLASVERNLIG